MICKENFILLGGRTLISQRVSWAVSPSVMYRSGRSAKDASFRLGACPLLSLLFPRATLLNSIVMSNPKPEDSICMQRCAPSFCVTIETPDAGSKRGGGCVACEKKDQ